MSSRSSIERLPRVVRDAVNTLIDNGATVDEMVAYIREQGATCSRSAVGRYARRQRELIDRRQQFEQDLEDWLRMLGVGTGDSTALVALEALRTLALSSVTRLGEAEQPPETEEVARLALALRRIEGADRIRDERERKTAGAAGPDPRRRGGLSPETVSLLHEAVAGRDPGLPPDPDRAEVVDRLRRKINAELFGRERRHTLADIEDGRPPR